MKLSNSVIRNSLITVLLAIPLLAGCASTKPDDALIQVCAIQVVKVMSETLFVVEEHCEPDGEKV